MLFRSEDVLTPDGALMLDSDEFISSKRASTLSVPSFMLDEKTVTAAEKGTATHVFMQFCSFENLKGDIEKEIDRLVKKRFILPSHASIINRNAVKKFAESDIFKEINASTDVQREYRFNIKLPASEFTANEELKKMLADEHVFVQGIIDCYFRDQNGDIILLDYKTDYVPSDIRGNEELENRFFTERHSRQLKYYKEALKLLTGKNVKRTVIYSFSLAKTIEIQP